MSIDPLIRSTLHSITDVFQSSLEQVVAAKFPVDSLPVQHRFKAGKAKTSSPVERKTVTDTRSIARRTLHTLKHIWPKEYGLNHVWEEQRPTGINKVTTPLPFINHNSRESELKVGIILTVSQLVLGERSSPLDSLTSSLPPCPT